MGWSGGAEVFSRGSRHSHATTCHACIRGWIWSHHHLCWRYRCPHTVSYLQPENFFLFVPEVWHKKRTRFIDIGKVATSWRWCLCALIGFHAFTGCDTVSAFAGRGKLNALKQMRAEQAHQEAFAQLGESWEVSPELFEKIQRFTCQMYISPTKTWQVNKLRYQLFYAKCGEVESCQLPPCEDSLYMHVLHANYQAAIKKCCSQSQPFLSTPNGYGWTLDNRLTIE